MVKKNKKKILIVSRLKNEYTRQTQFKKFLKKNYDLLEVEFVGNFFLKNLYLLKFFFIKFDYIFIFWPTWSSIFTLYLFKIFKKKKIIYDAFTIPSEDYLDNNLKDSNKLKYFFYYKIEKAIFKISDYIITDSETHKNKIAKLYFKKKKDILSFEPSEKNINNIQYKTNEDYLEILHGGANRNAHGVENMLKLIAFAPINLKKKIRFKLLLPDYGDKLKKYSNNLGLKKIVIFKPRLNFKKYLREVLKSDVALGIFGISEKSKHVISNFMVTSCNYGKIIITNDNKTSRFYLNKNSGVFFLKGLKQKKFNLILKKILLKKNNYRYQTKKIFLSYFNEKIVYKKFVNFFSKIN